MSEITKEVRSSHHYSFLQNQSTHGLSNGEQGRFYIRSPDGPKFYMRLETIDIEKAAKPSDKDRIILNMGLAQQTSDILRFANELKDRGVLAEMLNDNASFYQNKGQGRLSLINNSDWGDVPPDVVQSRCKIHLSQDVTLSLALGALVDLGLDRKVADGIAKQEGTIVVLPQKGMVKAKSD